MADKKVTDEKKFIAVGEMLDGRWENVRVLGEGGFGAVYEVKGTEGEHKDKHYALKVIFSIFFFDFPTKFFDFSGRGEGYPGLHETAGHGARRAARPARHQRQALLQVHHGRADGSVPIPDHVVDRQVAGGSEEGRRTRHRSIEAVQPGHVAVRRHRDARVDPGAAQNRVSQFFSDFF